VNEVDRKLLAFLAALVVALGAAWAWQSGRLDGLAGAVSAKLHEATISGLMEGPYGTMTREMAERVYEIMRKRPEDRAPEEVAWAYDALCWIGQLDRAEEFVAPTAAAKRALEVIKSDQAARGDMYFILSQSVEVGKAPGGRAVAVVTTEYWWRPSEKTRAEKGLAWAGERWLDRMEYPLSLHGGVWVIDAPNGKGLGGTLLEKSGNWPPLLPWPPK
jgi:hypothetical protein